MSAGAAVGAHAADADAVENLLGKSAHFGEAQGKLSDVYGVIKEGDIVLVSDDPKVVEALRGFRVGYNPLDYVEEE